jgi:ABC-type polysaccharide/polyol phosphate export permease
MFFSTALGSATNALVSNNNLITKVYFPREILPLIARAGDAGRRWQSVVGPARILARR